MFLKSYGLVKPNLTSIKQDERGKCDKTRNITLGVQSHLSNPVVVLLWFGCVMLPVEVVNWRLMILLKRINAEVQKHSPAGQQCFMVKVTHELF